MNSKISFKVLSSFLIFFFVSRSICLNPTTISDCMDFLTKQWQSRAPIMIFSKKISASLKSLEWLWLQVINSTSWRLNHVLLLIFSDDLALRDLSMWMLSLCQLTIRPCCVEPNTSFHQFSAFYFSLTLFSILTSVNKWTWSRG